MTTQRLLIATLLASLAAPALADAIAIAETDGERRIVIRQDAIALQSGQHAALRVGDSLGLAGAVLRLGGNQVVKGAPYSAEAVSERLQHLGDGNEIVTRSSVMHYRDSAGRTRTEVRNDDGDVRSVTINDPVAGTRWILNPERKTAYRSAITSDAARAGAEQARLAAARARGEAAQARAEAVRERAAADGTRRAAEQQRQAAEQGRSAAEAVRRKVERLRDEGKLAATTQVIVKNVDRDGERPAVQVRIAQPAPPALPAARAISAQIAPIIVSTAGDGKWAAKAVTRELGTRDMAGVRAEGQQRSYEIPAGEIGNRNPITVSSETWTAPDLKIVVQQKNSDPRSGELVYRLEGLQRAEPGAALFAAPADYTVRDASAVTVRTP